MTISFIQAHDPVLALPNRQLGERVNQLCTAMKTPSYDENIQNNPNSDLAVPYFPDPKDFENAKMRPICFYPYSPSAMLTVYSSGLKSGIRKERLLIRLVMIGESVVRYHYNVVVKTSIEVAVGHVGRSTED